MLANEKLSPAKLRTLESSPNDDLLIAAVAAAFLLLHILAGMMLLQAPATAPQDGPSSQDVSSLYD